MTTLRKSMMIGLLAVGLGAGTAGAWADMGEGGFGHGRHGHGGARMHSPEQMKQAFEKRQQQLHDKLKLDARQETAWKTYVDTIRPAAPATRPSREELAKLPAPDRLQKRMEFLQEHEKRLALRIAATREFYAVLTPEQKKVFDAGFAHGPRGGRDRERGHHGPHGEKS
ncbi:hypothetical protein NCCP691_17090 [Noviherbaspirillum aridicola]|uniref:LTXXQ motif family protein n=2 Tax=Noviherbaspirillum aridicola TaxID=2849687 RepID=A0ABQ4Q4E6_9BURK|nr:hypothetical protein NCCP691_17090 [Noviherbaspirillum aridicola]